MGWFENQIEDRRNADQHMLDESYFKLTDVLMGERTVQRMRDERIATRSTIDEILKYFHYQPVEIPDSITSPTEQLEYCLKPYGIMRRPVDLTEGWYKDTYGPILACRKEDKAPVALLPGSFNRYYYNNANTGEKVWLNRKNASQFERKGTCFYRSLPMRKISLRDLLRFMRRSFSLSDRVGLMLSTIAVALISLLLPFFTQALTGPVLSSQRIDALAVVAISIFCVTLSSQLTTIVKGLVSSRISNKMTTDVMAAMILRMTSLPASFFRHSSPGELRSRIMSVMELCRILTSVVMSTGMLSLISLVNMVQILHFTPALVLPSLLVIIATFVFAFLTTDMRMRLNKKQMEHAARESGMTYSIITGVQKIKLTGAEKRIFSKWLSLYAEGAELTYNPPLLLKLESVVTLAITLLSTIILYTVAVHTNIEPSAYFAFTAAYGTVMGALTTLNGTTLSAAQIRPILEQVMPFLKEEPEASDGKEIVTTITGSVEMDHVSFRYDKDRPWILRDLSLKIHARDYVAIVGKTGCGKSTLIRLLLGFETPEEGAVLYDGKNLESLDHASLRRRIGTVLQSGGLFQGDIFSNIIITAPELTLDDAWEAARTAGIAEDIEAMPMGMHTVIGESQGGISGGQRQRLMIARAIAPKPKLLILDEATSALDNKTQRQVSEALDAMGCTRIVIAHRLSTIRHCNRILVLDGGRIIEDGTYDELIEKGGFFADLVERQRLENDSAS